jgi:uncharacterized membrane protein
VSDAATPIRRNIWLILSLCLNVALIAMIAVGIWRSVEKQREASLGRAFSAQSIVAHLPPDRAARVQAVIDAHAAKLGALADEAERSRLNARPFFTAEKFDAIAYARAQQGMRQADDALQAERLRQLAEIAAILTPRERHEIAERARKERRPARRH